MSTKALVASSKWSEKLNLFFHAKAVNPRYEVSKGFMNKCSTQKSHRLWVSVSYRKRSRSSSVSENVSYLRWVNKERHALLCDKLLDKPNVAYGTVTYHQQLDHGAQRPCLMCPVTTIGSRNILILPTDVTNKKVTNLIRWKSRHRVDRTGTYLDPRLHPSLLTYVTYRNATNKPPRLIGVLRKRWLIIPTYVSFQFLSKQKERCPSLIKYPEKVHSWPYSSSLTHVTYRNVTNHFPGLSRGRRGHLLTIPTHVTYRNVTKQKEGSPSPIKYSEQVHQVTYRNVTNLITWGTRPKLRPRPRPGSRVRILTSTPICSIAEMPNRLAKKDTKKVLPILRYIRKTKITYKDENHAKKVILKVLRHAQDVDLNPGPQHHRPETKLTLITQNCRGLGEQRKLKHILNNCHKLGKESECYIVALQETMITHEQKIKYGWIGTHVFNPGTGHGKGCITLMPSHMQPLPNSIVHLQHRGHIFKILVNQ